jgi:hypothetical protein
VDRKVDNFCEDERNEDGGETKGNQCRKHGEGYSHERAIRDKVELEMPYKNERAAIRILSNVSRKGKRQSKRRRKEKKKGRGTREED